MFRVDRAEIGDHVPKFDKCFRYRRDWVREGQPTILHKWPYYLLDVRGSEETTRCLGKETTASYPRQCPSPRVRVRQKSFGKVQDPLRRTPTLFT
ncbi:hypothetical protein AVEN_93488-1 [Araneus ventricosus]|uniref:Uncharacterized protein n=1 Tax=Araneus ventricosus TaxID=182803 RepID=A0A4Y2AP84_ARAVE|nr:hypothetical protein AVEN_93488-1 [Araneus ventricosus]